MPKSKLIRSFLSLLFVLILATPLVAVASSDTNPVFRLYNPVLDKHVLSIDSGEVSILSNSGWNNEGIAFYGFNSNAPGSSPVNRLYNPVTGRHLYVANDYEVNALVASGWDNNGVMFYSLPAADTIPVVRLFNPANGQHVFSTSPVEISTLAGSGWNNEGTAFYAIEASAPQEVMYIGNQNSKIFHRLNCRYVAEMNPANMVEFTSVGAAEAAGYRPCLVCKP